MLTVIVTIFASSFMLALSGALMPGPLLTVAIRESSHRGALVGPLMIFGHALLELGVVVALLVGLAPLLLRDDVFAIISFVGGSILMWMAVSMLKTLPRLSFQLSVDGKKCGNLIVAGVLLSAVNPYFILWWATIGLGYIVYSTGYGVVGVVSFFTGHICADLLWYSCVSFGVHKGKHFLTDRGYRFLSGCCAIVLVIFSGYFFYSGVVKLV